MRSLSDIRQQRGCLLERITTQRYMLMAEVQPVRHVLDKTDHVFSHIRSGVDYVKRYPAVAGLVVAVLMTVNARRVWRVARRGFVVWRTWRMVRERLALSGWPGFR